MGFLAALALGLVFSGPSLEDVNRAARHVLADDEIQSEFPGTGAPPRRAPRRPPPPPPGEMDDVFGALFWVLVIVGVILLAFYLVRRMSGYASNVEVAASEDDAVPRPSADGIPDPAVLAREGRFAEAIHALLLLSIRSLGRSVTVAGSKTSREILRDVPLEAEAHEAVSALVDAVELSLFGGRPTDETDYAACADHYRHFQAVQTGAQA